jgi:hypothetical protein
MVDGAGRGRPSVQGKESCLGVTGEPEGGTPDAYSTKLLPPRRPGPAPLSARGSRAGADLGYRLQPLPGGRWCAGSYKVQVGVRARGDFTDLGSVRFRVR